MPLIGTAGHVDHGKSTLVEALSGRDPDRWAEEKKRGLTIDLGFAWADLGTGQEVSFVDVPGHERYLKNMLAGIEAIDVALLVVAANEGWMPQTEEHVAVLDLLGVNRGVVAVTKVDLVDDETAELAALEAEDRLAGTSLQASPIVRVSSTEGIGMTELQRLLAIAIDEGTGRPESRARLWVDRAFTVSGTGTVVTGSLLGGSLHVGDRVNLHPAGSQAKVRTLQTHETETDHITAGRRAAVGLSGADTGDVTRGDLLTKDDWRISTRFVANYRLARYVDELPARGAYQIHIGSRTTNVTILKANQRRMILAAAEGIPIVMGERFIIRDTSRRQVIAGGQILDPHPRQGQLRSAARRRPPPRGPCRSAACDSASGTTPRTSNRQRRWDTQDGVRRWGDSNHGGLVDMLVQRSESLVATEHAERPLRNGVALATLAEQLGVERAVAELVVEQSQGLDLRGPDVAENEHEPRLTGDRLMNGSMQRCSLGRAGSALDR